MKVYLINPPSSNGVEMVREGRCMQRKGAWTTVWPPVTLATMAAMLLKEGIEVKLNDCIVEDISKAFLKSNIRQFNPDLLVINTATASIYSDLDCARIAKEIHPGIKTLAFGLHVTVLPDEAFSISPFLDYIIRGEPEFCIVELAKKLKEGDNNIDKIKGLSFRTGSRIQHNPDGDFREDLNKLTFPAWQLINVKNYLLPLSGKPFLLITTSKGCSHSCLFCPAKPFYGSRLRLRDVKIVVDEMEYIEKQFNVKDFLIWSESFTESRDYVVNLCNEIINRNLYISWVCNSRVDKIDLELLKFMKKAGCWMIGYGVESGNQQVLDNSNKGITIEQIENAVNLAKKAGIEVTAHMIFGLPGETLQTGLDTIKWLNELDVDFVQAYCAVPWPSTPLYLLAKRENWFISKEWELFEQNRSVMDIGTITPHEVEFLRRKAFRMFYLSPRFILKALSKIRSINTVRFIIKMLKEFSTWF